MSELAQARALVEALPDAAVLYDATLVALGYNLRWQELTGLRHRALEARMAAGESPFDLVRRDGGGDLDTARTCLSTGRPIHLAEVALENATGTLYTAHVSFMPVMGDGGQALGVIHVVRNVSDEARVQARYRELLDQARLRAENLEREVEKRTQELSAALEAVTRLSREDPLTSLLNRRSFTELAERALRLAARHGRTTGLLLCDLDRFKRINDTYGHQTGDAVLLSASRALAAAVRNTDLVGRFGGEEFVILLDETAPETVALTANRCRTAVATIDPTGSDVPVPTISIGAAIFPQDGQTLDQLISRADTALYRAKHRGRNQVVMFDADDAGDSAEAAAGGRAETARPEVPCPEEVAAGQRPRVMVVGTPVPGTASAEGRPDTTVAIATSLACDFEVVVERGGGTGATRCEESSFDAVIADFAVVDQGIDFLRQVLRKSPGSLRVLVLEDESEFAAVRGTTLARVDCFMVRREAPQQAVGALRHALARREVDRQRLYLASDDVGRLFSRQLIELDRLIEQAAIGFVYQPIVEPRTRQVRAYEALCRARHPVFSDPSVLFEAALQSGNLWRLGRLTRHKALERLAGLGGNQHLFINLHPAELDDPQLLSELQHDLAGRVVLEITERAAIPDFNRFRATTQALTAAGYRLAIDDLGAGYASLNAVALIEPSFVKLDMSMVRGLDHSRHKARLVGHMVEFANDVGIEVVAEGVETEAEARAVGELGCHLAQGYFFGPPE